MSDYGDLCVCGHVADEHVPGSGTCDIEDCLCACFEPDDEDDT